MPFQRADARRPVTRRPTRLLSHLPSGYARWNRTSPPRRSGRGGLTLVELLMGMLLAGIVLGMTYVLVFGGMRTLRLTQAADEAHGEYLVLREYLGRDIPEAGTLISEIDLDGRHLATGLADTTETLILRLPEGLRNLL